MYFTLYTYKYKSCYLLDKITKLKKKMIIFYLYKIASHSCFYRNNSFNIIDSTIE